MKLPSNPLLPPPEQGVDYLRRLNVRLYDLWRAVVTAVNERVTVMKNGTRAGAQPAVNFIQGSGCTITVAEDPANGRINVTISVP